jgi:hypothetical protein
MQTLTSVGLLWVSSRVALARTGTRQGLLAQPVRSAATAIGQSHIQFYDQKKEHTLKRYMLYKNGKMRKDKLAGSYSKE